MKCDKAVDEQVKDWWKKWVFDDESNVEGWQEIIGIIIAARYEETLGEDTVELMMITRHVKTRYARANDASDSAFGDKRCKIEPRWCCWKAETKWRGE